MQSEFYHERVREASNLYWEGRELEQYRGGYFGHIPTPAPLPSFNVEPPAPTEFNVHISTSDVSSHSYTVYAEDKDHAEYIALEKHRNQVGAPLWGSYWIN